MKPDREKKKVELPVDVLAVIDGAGIVVRSSISDDGLPNVIFQPADTRGWMQSPEEDERRLKSLFPDLDEAQVRRAKRFIASRVRNHFRQMAQANSGQMRCSWLTDY